MKAGWIRTKLAEVAIIHSGAGFPEKYQGTQDQDIPFYKVSDMNLPGNEQKMIFANNTISEEVRRSLSASLVPSGSIIFPKIGGAIATNKKRLTTRDCCFDNNVMGVSPKREKVDGRFLYYFFVSHNLSDFANKAALPSIKKSVIEERELTLPASLAEQKRIVAILDAAFEALDTAKANAERNAANATALFDSYLDATVSKGGDGWITTTIDKLADNCDSERVPITKGDRKSGIYPYYGASGIVDHVADYIFDGDHLLISEDGANLLARSSPIAFSASGKYWVNNHAHILRFDSPATQKFVEYYVNSIKIDQYVTGAAQPKLTQQALNRIPIAIPKDIGEQQSIVNSLEAIQAEVARIAGIYASKISALDNLRVSILQQAFSGELAA